MPYPSSHPLPPRISTHKNLLHLHSHIQILKAFKTLTQAHSTKVGEDTHRMELLTRSTCTSKQRNRLDSLQLRTFLLLVCSAMSEDHLLGLQSC
jgi:hypothetical protein